LAKYYREKVKGKKKTFYGKLIEAIVISLVVAVIIYVLRFLITSIPVAMAFVGLGTLIVSLFVRPSIKAIWHALICAGCSGLFLLNLTPFMANVHLFEGYKAADAKRWDIAIKNYQKALKYDPRDGELNFYTGFAYMKKKEYDKAAYYFKRSLLTKLDPSAFNNLGNVYLEKGEFEKAEKAYLDALYTQVSRMYSLNNLGAIYQKTGRLDESLEMFEEALKANPKYKIARKNLEVVKKLRQKYAFIEKRYGKDFLRHFFTAQSFLQYKRKDKAKDEYLMASKILLEKDKNIGPGNPEWGQVLKNLAPLSLVYSNVASNLVKLGEIRQAISLYEVTVKFKPRNLKQIYQYIASLYFKIGEKEKAQKMLEKARSLR